jgi:ABC-type transport system involved in multi-copper enzyme maturation permease subunit
VTEAARNLADLVAVIVAIGVVLATQGLLIDERRNGVLEWLLSKPLSRPAVIVAKFTGHGLGLLLTVIVIPWLVVLALLSIADGSLYSPGRTAAAGGMIALVALFHLALVLLLSTLTVSRIVVLAVPIVAVVSADGLIAMMPQLFEVLPWSLGGIASVMLSDGLLITGWPIAATIAWTALLLAAAAWRFERTDL